MNNSAPTNGIHTAANIIADLGITPVPADFYTALEQWETIKDIMGILKERELTLRTALMASTFKAPKEGANRAKLRDGRVLVATHKVNRSVDSTKLPQIDQELAAMRSNYRTTEFFKTRHDLLLTDYRSAPPNIQQLLDRAITLKPGTPNLEIKDAE